MTTMNAIYGARTAAGLDDDTARDLYQRVTGKRSLRDMSVGEQVRVLNELRKSPTTAPRALSGPYAKKLQALWIDGWNLGIVEDRRDSAMLAFMARQTGIQRTEFLRDAATAQKAVEGLKKWIERAAGVEWGEHADLMDAVIAAQVRILHLDQVIDAGEAKQFEAYLAWRAEDLDRVTKIAVMQLFGECIRKAKRETNGR